MSLEGATAPDQSVAPVVPEVEATEAKDETVNLETQTSDEQAAEEPAPPEDDSEEVEYEGDKYRLPKKLKDALLRQQDYTRKTTEVAELRRTVEAEQAAFKQQTEAASAHIREVAQVVALNEQLGQFDQIDWNKLQQDDPFKATELFQQRTLLKERRDGLAAQIQYNEQQRSQQTQQEFAKRYAETNARLATEIPGWLEVAPKVATFAQVRGVDPVHLREIATHPVLSKLLHEAHLWNEHVNAQTTQAKAAAKPAIQPKPITKISGTGARTTLTPETATDMESYVAARKKQGYGKR
jgi:hypothetical protein